jgi:hypothetical protein
MAYLVKNTYGISAVVCPTKVNLERIGEYGGSSLNRKTYPKKMKSLVEELLKKRFDEKPKEEKLRKMSPRTKAKIRKKLIAFARISKTLSFLTLTFCNEVEDKKAVKVLADFLENAGKRSKDFQYLWVAEKQEENPIFKKNIHFHIITNKFWKIQRWWQYWLDLQAKYGITPRDKDFKPSSAFDVKQVQKDNIRGLVKYLTKYVTKNASLFGCQVWNCSKKISRLYTDFYTGMSFIRELERLEKLGVLGGELKVIPQEWCNIHLVPLNRTTLKFYERLEAKNRREWNKEEVVSGR